MKNIVFVGVGLVLVAAVFWAVLVANPPVANVTIHAVRPTGEYQTGTNHLGREVRVAVWRFSVTNASRVTADWDARLDLSKTSDWEHVAYTPVAWWAWGTLAPNQQCETNMTVPADGEVMWRSVVVSYATPGRLESARLFLRDHVPKLWERVPASRAHKHFDDWRVATNAISNTSVTPAEH